MTDALLVDAVAKAETETQREREHRPILAPDLAEDSAYAAAPGGRQQTFHVLRRERHPV